MPAKRKHARVEGAEDAAPGGAAVNHNDDRSSDGNGHVTECANTSSATLPPSHCGPLNPVFALTGPRGGCLSGRVAAKTLAQLADLVDDGVWDTLSAAWSSVDVPADQYWSWRGGQQDLLTGPAHAGFSKSPAAVLRVPDPAHVQLSFYPTRLEAMAGFGYDTRHNKVVLAADKRGGSGSKIFTVLSRGAVHSETDSGTNTSPLAGTAAADGDESAEDGLPAPGLHAGGGGRAVAAFVKAIPKLYERCLYVLVDEAAPIDPFFDIDCHFSAAEDRADAKLPFFADPSRVAACGVTQEEVEDLLAAVLRKLKAHLEAFFATKVAECLVLTSTVQQLQQSSSAAEHALSDLKLSFHVHFRLHNSQAVSTIRDLHLCMAQLRECADAHLKTPLESGAEATSSSRREWYEWQAVRQCVDFGVYTRWRALRLPYNVKTPLDRGSAFTAVDAAADDLLESQLAQSGVLRSGDGLPAVTVGSIAPHLVTTVQISQDPSQRAAQRLLLGKMMYRLRALLPVVPGATDLRADGALKVFLEAHAPHIPTVEHHTGSAAGAALGDHALAFANTVFDLALVQRDGASPRQPLHLLHAPSSTADESRPPPASAEATTTANPFRVQRPVFPRCVRQVVQDAHRKELIAEVFRCLSPRYAGAVVPSRAVKTTTDSFDQVQPAAPLSGAARDVRPITADGLIVHYEESIRAYYANQKLNKYCLRQDRVHKATYAQLYLTYGSIKVRCYANDCCERCLYVPWSASADHQPEEAQTSTAKPSTASELPRVEGYPRFDRLQAIHAELFPPLPLDEIVRRYGTEAVAQP